MRADTFCSVVKNVADQNRTFEAFDLAKSVDNLEKRTLLAYTRCNRILTDIAETVQKVRDALRG